jgi:carboxylate-amine ligase
VIAACVIQTALEYDERGYSGAGEPLGDREIEENLWRAIRYGLDGELIDFRGRRLVPTRQVVEELVLWTEPAREAAGIELSLPEENGAQRQRRMLAEGASIEEIYRRAVEETQATYPSPQAAVVDDACRG